MEFIYAININYMLDLSKVQYTGNVKKNIKNIITKYGTNFIIKNENIKLPIKVSYHSEKYNDDVKYYTFVYSQKNRKTPLHPFKIIFYDTENFKENNNCEISNIQKTKEYSGTNIMNTILKLLRVLNIKRVNIADGATIKCNNSQIDLTLFKLIEKNVGFYARFGFKSFISYIDYENKTKYKNATIMNQVLILKLQQFRNIKIDTLIALLNKLLSICTSILKTQDYTNVKIYVINNFNTTYLLDKQYRAYILALFEDIDILLHILLKFKNKKLGNVLIYLFYNHCELYQDIFNIIGDSIYSIEYQKDKVEFKFKILYREIRPMRYAKLYLDL